MTGVVAAVSLALLSSLLSFLWLPFVVIGFALSSKGEEKGKPKSLFYLLD
jgi:hypothetical protein